MNPQFTRSCEWLRDGKQLSTYTGLKTVLFVYGKISNIVTGPTHFVYQPWPRDRTDVYQGRIYTSCSPITYQQVS